MWPISASRVNFRGRENIRHAAINIEMNCWLTAIFAWYVLKTAVKVSVYRMPLSKISKYNGGLTMMYAERLTAQGRWEGFVQDFSRFKAPQNAGYHLITFWPILPPSLTKRSQRELMPLPMQVPGRCPGTGHVELLKLHTGSLA